MVTDKSLILASHPLPRFPHLMHYRTSPYGIIRSFHKFIGTVALATNLKICFVLTTKHLASPFVNILKQLLNKKITLTRLKVRVILNFKYSKLFLFNYGYLKHIRSMPAFDRHTSDIHHYIIGFHNLIIL